MRRALARLDPLEHGERRRVALQPGEELAPPRRLALHLEQDARGVVEHEAAEAKLARPAGRRYGRKPTPWTVPRTRTRLRTRRAAARGASHASSHQLPQRVVGARLRLLDPGDVLGASDHHVVGEPLAGDRGRRRSRPSRSSASPCAAPRPAPRSRCASCPRSRARAARLRATPYAITWREKIASVPMSLAIAVRIAESSVRSIAGRLRAAPYGARKSATASIASVAEPPLPSASSLPPRSKLARSAAAALDQRRAVVGQGLRPQRADLPRLHQHRAAHVLDDRLELPLLLAEERIQEARGSGVVHAALLAALEQTAVLEEHVHELPQHVVERLDQLLADVAGPSSGGSNSYSAPAAEKATVRQPRCRASATARTASPPSSSVPNAITMSSRTRQQVDLRIELAAPRRSGRSPGSARLPTITGWTNSTATCRASERAAGERPSAISLPPRANRSAIRWQSRASRSDSRAKKRSLACVRAVQQRLEAFRSDRWPAQPSRHASASSRAATPLQPLAPRVDALAGACADQRSARRRDGPGRCCRGAGRDRSRGGAAGRSC